MNFEVMNMLRVLNRNETSAFFLKWNRTHAHVKSEKSKTFLWLKKWLIKPDQWLKIGNRTHEHLYDN